MIKHFCDICGSPAFTGTLPGPNRIVEVPRRDESPLCKVGLSITAVALRVNQGPTIQITPDLCPGCILKFLNVACEAMLAIQQRRELNEDAVEAVPAPDEEG